MLAGLFEFDVSVSKGKRLLRRLIIPQRSTIKISRFSKIISSSKCFHVLPKSHNRNVLLVFLEIELYSNIIIRREPLTPLRVVFSFLKLQDLRPLNASQKHVKTT